MMRAIGLALLIGVLAPPLPAQEPPRIAKLGKWVLAAGAVTMNVLAAKAHDRADEAFDQLESRCLEDHARCALDQSGHYVDAESEALYQRSLHYDRRARGWLIGGETALAGAAVLLVWELVQRKSKPDNIPFAPEVRTLRRATGIGLKLPL